MAAHSPPPPPPPPPPLHRITVVLRTLRRSQWLNHIHTNHTQPLCRQHVHLLFWHIDRFLLYIRRHSLLRPISQDHGGGGRRDDDVELRRMHQEQIRVSLTRIRHYIRPLHQYLRCHQPGQLNSYHECMNILHIFTSHL